MKTETTTKPGIKTTEFWLTLAFMALANLGPLASEIPGQWGVLANAIVLAAYTLSRGKAKSLGVVLPLLLCSFLCLSLPSCINSYIVDGAGRDWEANPVQTLPANRVTPLADVPVPEDLGGGTITVPITITPTK